MSKAAIVRKRGIAERKHEKEECLFRFLLCFYVNVCMQNRCQ